LLHLLVLDLLLLLFHEIFIHEFKIFILSLSSEDDLRRVALAYDIKWLLHVFEYDFSGLFKASHLHFDNFADGLFILLDVFDAVVIFDDAGDTEIEAAKYDPFLDVLDKG
jgi:hypothetical protein